MWVSQYFIASLEKERKEHRFLLDARSTYVWMKSIWKNPQWERKKRRTIFIKKEYLQKAQLQGLLRGLRGNTAGNVLQTAQSSTAQCIWLLMALPHELSLLAADKIPSLPKLSRTC
ncbi:hypothetical protein MJG53_005360 [Ovis ammon polii x Ovis aries]|uniref:Uncharacterized protein n=1 Tax=Ovis ammon polii x Ovis aries TaxID=2918886 RepID=A0ACB9VD67_9CETA|nr:hypothetical protein MJG53_005360 [Ovis ammon polii x Ovis aries]